MADAGKVIAYAGASPGTGWLICDGASYLRASYPDLFGEIGTTYGAADGTHFNVPDLRGRHALGKTAIGTGSALAEAGGSLAHSHSGPSHSHAVTQPSAHSAHVVTQPSAHTTLAHSGFAALDHAAATHSGAAISAHSVTASSSHGTHTSSGSHNHDDHTLNVINLTNASGTVQATYSPVSHSNEGSHTHDAHSAHNESVSAHSVSSQGANHAVLAHSATQPSDHASITHSGAAVDGHSAHAGMASSANSAATGTGDAPWLSLNYIIGTGANPAPAGSVIGGGLGSPPANHLLCDGASYATATYPDLFAAIGYTYGGAGASFNVPDLRNRHILGKAAAGTGSTLGSSGGASAHTHAGGSHTHPVTQASAHSAHVVTQPLAHSLTHSGAAMASHADQAHSGLTVASHSVTQSSGHGTHSSSGSHDHDDHATHSAAGGSDPGVWLGEGGTHAAEGGHTHDSHSAHSGAALSAHSVTQASSHTLISHSVTQPDAHSISHTGAALDAHSAHAGASIDAGGTAASTAGDAPYLGLHHYIKTVVAVQPIGTTFAIGRATAPVGALTCDGSAVSRATYAALFSAIGTTFGAGDGSTTFNLPDLRGRIPRGAGGSGPALAASGGALDHTHVAATHTHPVTQPSGHSAHAATQPSAHVDQAHVNAAIATHTLAHSGFSVADHSVTQASSHGTHSSSGSHNHDAHAVVDGPDIPGGGNNEFVSPTTHATQSGHTHNAHSAHSGFAVGAHGETQASSHSLTHTTTQPSNHTVSAHAAFAVDAHSAHAGFATVTDGALATGAANPPYLVVAYAIQALTDIEVHSGQVAFSEGDSFDVTSFVVDEDPVPSTPPSGPILYILDATTLAVYGVIDRAATVSVTRRLWGVDTITVRLDASQAYAAQVVTGRLLYAPLIDFDAPLAFLVEQVERTEEKGLATLVVGGRTMDGIALAERLCYPPGGFSHDEQTSVAAETAIKHYVIQNAEAGAAASRQVPNFVVATTGGGGITVSAAARYQRVVDIVRELGLLAEIGWKVTFEAGTNDHVFEIIEGADLSASVFFDFEFDTVEKWEEVNSTLESKSLVVVAGQGEGTARDIVIRPAVEPTGLARREAFVDARDVELGNTALLQARGDATLAATEPETALVVTPRQFGAFQYTQDWHLGDIVLVRNAERGISRAARVIEVTITAEASAAVPTITAVLDRAEPTLRDRVEGPFSSAVQENAHTHTGIDHATLANVTANQHHAQSHVHLADGSGTVAHSSLSGIAATDHHAAPVAGPDANITVDAAGAAGTAGAFARSAHGHQVVTVDSPSGANITVDAAATAAATGAIARAAHGHRVNTSSSAQPASTRAGGAGTSGTLARAAHTHAKPAPIVRVYTAGATWTKPAGLDYIVVECVGGGGGGAGADATTASQYSGGGGGGGGGYARKKFDVEDLSGAASFTVAVGGSGTAGNNTGTAGGTGGNSTFSGTGITTVQGNGGGGGEGGAATGGISLRAGGAGGTASGGDVNVTGSDGLVMFLDAGRKSFGTGGASGGGFGGGGRVNAADGGGAGDAGGQYGGGGGAGQSSISTAGFSGGAGAAGVVVVTEHYL